MHLNIIKIAYYFAVYLFGFSVLTSCVTRAPSKYELDKVAGRTPKKLDKETEKKFEKDLEKIKHVNAEKKPAQNPKFIKPRVEKVWVYDQELSESLYLQGTFVYLRLDNGRWLGSGQ